MSRADKIEVLAVVTLAVGVVGAIIIGFGWLARLIL